MIENPAELVLELREDRLQRNKILAAFLKDEQTVTQLVKVATVIAPYPLQEHSSWLLIHATEQRKRTITPHQPQIIDAFMASTDQTVLRNLCNVLYKLPLIEYRESELLECLIDHLKNESNKIALHVYALYKLIQYVQKYPEIKREIDEIIDLKSERNLPPSFTVAIRKYREAMKKLN